MNIVFLTLAFVTLANLGLAVLVWRHHPRAEVNRVFALTALSVAGWTWTNALFQSADEFTVALQAAEFSYLSAVILAASFLHFSWVFPFHQQTARRYKRTLWITTLLVGLLPFVPGLVIRSLHLTAERAIETAPGIYAITLFMLVASVWAFANFLQHQFSRASVLRPVAREQSRYVLTGAAFTAVVGLVCNLLLPLLGNYSFVWLGPVSSLCFIGFTVYAIIAHHLFDIRLIIKRTLLYSLLVAAVGAVFSVAEHTLTEAFGHLLGEDNPSWLSNVGGAVVVSFGISPLRDWMEKQLDYLLYPHKRHKLKHTRTRANQKDG